MWAVRPIRTYSDLRRNSDRAGLGIEADRGGLARKSRIHFGVITMAKRRVETNTRPPARMRLKTTSKTPLAMDRISTLPDQTPQGQNEFYKYVDNCSKHRKMRMCSIACSVITTFKLEMDYCRRSGAGLDNCLPSLKILTLESIEVNDFVGDLVDVILLGCPSLEKLLLRDCWRMWNAQIHSLSLKFLEVDEMGLSFDTELMEVEAINLESFALFTDCYSINISACEAIKNLSLTDVVGGQSLEDIISELPLLENLTLTACYLEHIKISSQCLKSF
ncbi:LRR domain containing protein [Parasponia andersonii]|uniref:LRR domain containing protein n=1 Tax=Parasponia andersonii TaxID=3476 RepID=A0A2P5DAG3_PARAD|nr:LRR domain containing protein [Parasponia andersonii]